MMRRVKDRRRLLKSFGNNFVPGKTALENAESTSHTIIAPATGLRVGFIRSKRLERRRYPHLPIILGSGLPRDGGRPVFLKIRSQQGELTGGHQAIPKLFGWKEDYPVYRVGS